MTLREHPPSAAKFYYFYYFVTFITFTLENLPRVVELAFTCRATLENKSTSENNWVITKKMPFKHSNKI